jgi:hypothetical protein
MRSRKGCKSRSPLVTAPTVVPVPLLLSFLQMIMIVKGDDRSGALPAARRQCFVALQALGARPAPPLAPYLALAFTLRRLSAGGQRKGIERPSGWEATPGESVVTGFPRLRSPSLSRASSLSPGSPVRAGRRRPSGEARRVSGSDALGRSQDDPVPHATCAPQ